MHGTAPGTPAARLRLEHAGYGQAAGGAGTLALRDVDVPGSEFVPVAADQ